MAELKIIELALQGGGAHGAYTWGVLDQLLADPRIRIEGLSGTSAGAMNAVVLADGLHCGGESAAREALQDFWAAVSRAAMASPIRRTPLDWWLGRWSLDYSPGYLAMDFLSRVASPYQLNPLNFNPLRDILVKQVNFESVRSCPYIKLFVTATNVRSGKARVFRKEELSADAVLASACLPFLFKAVEIDGEAYWDGGYMGNPSLFPLLEECGGRDILIVQINPIQRDEVPTSAAAIMNRLNEITFNASLIKDIGAIASLKRTMEAGGSTEPACWRDVRFHRISADHELRDLSVSSKLNAEWAFLIHLRDIGRASAEHWLERNFDALGERSTLDIDAVYLN
ncbi:MAG: patatin-like phospholipase family protein [Candidatus Competibacteraceae bacterium]|nr:patatin-like phospholipase family protein [Candidatus Competibacteraceae bacterium]